MNDDANLVKLGQIFDGFAEFVEDPSEGELPQQRILPYLFGNRHQHDLGMIDSSAAEITVTVGGKDYAIKQSPGLLTSARAGGTTGAAVWRTTSLLAEWFVSSDNPLFKSGLLDETCTLLELGAGVAGLLPLVVAPQIKTYHATDQSYALKLLQENISANSTSKKRNTKSPNHADVRLSSLDWELDDVNHFLSSHDLSDGLDLIVASDCVYNYHLIEPLTNICAAICRHRGRNLRPTLCLIAQQVREPNVFEEWLTAFSQHFHVWRFTDSTLGAALGIQSGYY
ncbi:Diaminohydroxyphosphoribosylamino-pyrimidine deaminase [Elsinoe australis]|uniref:Diaminohydroxyphosphoribosylamino-pyrimidine deaminase n=1 Tax=Elsinoe australis TaxID=40998 RepID=A0A2P7YDN2_9PEZI|nr:Diaminohydroxyphosphoribosylamino-pyrimidine deaminase [Elsinoe australis]